MVFKESQINSTLVLNNMLTKNCIDDPMPSYTIFLIIVLSRIVALEMCYTASMFNWWTPWALTQSYLSNIFPKKFSLQVGVWVCLALCKSIDCSRQAPLSMGFSRQEYRSGLPFPPPGDLPDPGIKFMSSASQVDSLPLSYQGSLIFKVVKFRTREIHLLILNMVLK